MPGGGGGRATPPSKVNASSSSSPFSPLPTEIDVTGSEVEARSTTFKLNVHSMLSCRRSAGLGLERRGRKRLM